MSKIEWMTELIISLLPIGTGFLVIGVLVVVIHTLSSIKTDKGARTSTERFDFENIEQVPRWSFVLIHDKVTGKDYLGAMHGGMIELAPAPVEAK